MDILYKRKMSRSLWQKLMTDSGDEWSEGQESGSGDEWSQRTDAQSIVSLDEEDHDDGYQRLRTPDVDDALALAQSKRRVPVYSISPRDLTESLPLGFFSMPFENVGVWWEDFPDYSPDHEQTERWVSAHPAKYQQSAREAIGKINYVSGQQFENCTSTLVKRWIAKLKEDRHSHTKSYLFFKEYGRGETFLVDVVKASNPTFFSHFDGVYFGSLPRHKKGTLVDVCEYFVKRDVGQKCHIYLPDDAAYRGGILTNTIREGVTALLYSDLWYEKYPLTDPDEISHAFEQMQHDAFRSFVVISDWKGDYTDGFVYDDGSTVFVYLLDTQYDVYSGFLREGFDSNLPCFHYKKYPKGAKLTRYVRKDKSVRITFVLPYVSDIALHRYNRLLSRYSALHPKNEGPVTLDEIVYVQEMESIDVKSCVYICSSPSDESKEIGRIPWYFQHKLANVYSTMVQTLTCGTVNFSVGSNNDVPYVGPLVKSCEKDEDEAYAMECDTLLYHNDVPYYRGNYCIKSPYTRDPSYKWFNKYANFFVKQ